MATRRGRGTQAPQQSTPDVESSDSNSSITTIISTDSTSFENTDEIDDLFLFRKYCC